jgi:NADPH:quinone reductase-like Zn-dependent oxidoreductase
MLTDWKQAELMTQPGLIMGCDFVGIVHSIGSEVPSVPDTSPAPIPTEGSDVVQKGQLRYGFVRGGYTSPHTGIAKGSFAEYIAVEWDLTGLVPENVSPEQAASIAAPYASAVSSSI